MDHPNSSHPYANIATQAAAFFSDFFSQMTHPPPHHITVKEMTTIVDVGGEEGDSPVADKLLKQMTLYIC